ncbi:MAG TPA: hypothetical protein VGU69_10610 [Rhizomicrobium sp.]|nr:hypothetical protein [Rhizomicrobium sp.]
MKTETIVNALRQVGFDETQSLQLVNAMEDVSEIKVSPILAKIELIASEMQAKIHQESVTQLRWMVGAVLAAGGLVFAILKFLH